MNKALLKAVTNMRARGLTVTIIHLRALEVGKKLGGTVKKVRPRGGKTRVLCTLPVDPTLSPNDWDGIPQMVMGDARCSNKDTFCRDCGVNLATRRMLKNLHTLRGRAYVKEVISPLPTIPPIARTVTPLRLVKTAAVS